MLPTQVLSYSSEHAKKQAAKGPASIADRNVYITHLETQLERVTSACLVVQSFGDRMQQVESYHSLYEQKMQQLSSAIKLNQDYAESIEDQFNQTAAGQKAILKRTETKLEELYEQKAELERLHGSIESRVRVLEGQEADMASRQVSLERNMDIWSQNEEKKTQRRLEELDAKRGSIEEALERWMHAQAAEWQKQQSLLEAKVMNWMQSQDDELHAKQRTLEARLAAGVEQQRQQLAAAEALERRLADLVRDAEAAREQVQRDRAEWRDARTEALPRIEARMDALKQQVEQQASSTAESLRQRERATEETTRAMSEIQSSVEKDRKRAHKEVQAALEQIRSAADAHVAKAIASIEERLVAAARERASRPPPHARPARLADGSLQEERAEQAAAQAHEEIHSSLRRGLGAELAEDVAGTVAAVEETLRGRLQEEVDRAHRELEEKLRAEAKEDAQVAAKQYAAMYAESECADAARRVLADVLAKVDGIEAQIEARATAAIERAARETHDALDFSLGKEIALKIDVHRDAIAKQLEEQLRGMAAAAESRLGVAEDVARQQLVDEVAAETGATSAAICREAAEAARAALREEVEACMREAEGALEERVTLRTHRYLKALEGQIRELEGNAEQRAAVRAAENVHADVRGYVEEALSGLRAEVEKSVRERLRQHRMEAERERDEREKEAEEMREALLAERAASAQRAVEGRMRDLERAVQELAGACRALEQRLGAQEGLARQIDLLHAERARAPAPALPAPAPAPAPVAPPPAWAAPSRAPRAAPAGAPRPDLPAAAQAEDSESEEEPPRARRPQGAGAGVGGYGVDLLALAREADALKHRFDSAASSQAQRSPQRSPPHLSGQGQNGSAPRVSEPPSPTRAPALVLPLRPCAPPPPPSEGPPQPLPRLVAPQLRSVDGARAAVAGPQRRLSAPRRAERGLDGPGDPPGVRDIRRNIDALKEARPRPLGPAPAPPRPAPPRPASTTPADVQGAGGATLSGARSLAESDGADAA
eukprot:tig00000144_g9122.t1